MKRSNTEYGRQLRQLDRRLDLPPSEHEVIERNLSIKILERSLRAVTRTMRAIATERARKENLTREQFEMLVQLHHGDCELKRTDQLNAGRLLERRGLAKVDRRTASATELGRSAAEVELQHREVDVARMMSGLPATKKKDIVWALEVVANAMRKP